MGSLVSNVSDTARWVTAHRAKESARPDALFHDPLAERLAGEQGHAIIAAAPRSIRDGWWLVARTKIIDDLIAEAISQGCDRVLNLAAGLDTRPYRLDLPSDLLWVEADLPDLVAEKEQLLAGETPRCRLSRHAVDLADPRAREAFLDDALAGASKAFVLTEGLLMYLTDADVVGLSAAFQRPEIFWWTFDFGSGGIKATMNDRTDGMMRNAPIKFGPPNGVAFFEGLGWSTALIEPLLPAARRFRRLPLLLRLAALLPQPDPRKPGDKMWSAVACLTPPARSVR
ncbi:class I SAM-dependent methyltransferase [Mycolicibacterium pallens]|uniref:S-adenosyl-L-methionine-dependent methyltransferase n=1 Tax=Mycolicibacterium pallens TaxID=370524 RepID=A0ABX8VGA0_9MYCO|nr:SAM-dependent methyltransferase [Mycolicibacterium pallens]APE14682.1 methyltransferase [Mycobacterium sp. WY10]QYL14810.1 SAM-dependent methyltransferase [Mycolicibacterium pallens]